jgi:surfeit locus 1 family protein
MQRLIVLLAALATAAATARLGLWQLDRAAQKTALQQSLDARSFEPPLAARELARSAEAATAQHHRRVRIEGQFLDDATVFLDNRQMDKRPGFFVVTPLLLAPGDAVLVQRGWAPRDAADRSRLPALPRTQERTVGFWARIAPPPSRLFDFGAAELGRIRQNLDLDAYSREIGVALRPLSLLQLDESAPALGDGLLRRWAAPAVDVHKHYGYAVQWFALSALVTALYVWFQLIRPRLRTRSQR